MKSFNKTNVVVAGSASGIGKAIALAFAREGARLSLCDIDETGLGETREAVEALGTSAYSEVVDVSRAEQVERFCSNTYREFGRVDILVNSAGVAVGGFVEDMTLDDWEWQLDTNLWGVINGCHFFYRRMLEQGGGGHIVNIASVEGLVPLPLNTAYSVSKHAVVGYSEGLGGEAACHDIGVTVVCPGLVATNIAGNARLVSEGKRFTREQARERADQYFKRRGRPPEKVASAVLRAIAKNRGVVLVGAETVALDAAHRLSRRLVGFFLRLLNRLARRL